MKLFTTFFILSILHIVYVLEDVTQAAAAAVVEPPTTAKKSGCFSWIWNKIRAVKIPQSCASQSSKRSSAVSAINYEVLASRSNTKELDIEMNLSSLYSLLSDAVIPQNAPISKDLPVYGTLSWESKRRGVPDLWTPKVHLTSRIMLRLPCGQFGYFDFKIVDKNKRNEFVRSIFNMWRRHHRTYYLLKWKENFRVHFDSSSADLKVNLGRRPPLKILNVVDIFRVYVDGWSKGNVKFNKLPKSLLKDVDNKNCPLCHQYKAVEAAVNLSKNILRGRRDLSWWIRKLFKRRFGIYCLI